MALSTTAIALASNSYIENNTTTISWSCGFNPGHQYYSNAIKMSAVYINGSQVYSGGTYSNIIDYKNRTFASGTLTISHNTDGSKTFTVSGFNGWIYASGNTYASAQDFTLTTIPRASSISCSSANIGSNATISISRASSGFTHTLTYAFGSLNGTITTKTSSISVSFPLPTTFYAQIPNAKNGTGTITCYTYNGSTLIGTKTCSFVASCDEDSCKPTLSGTVVDSNTATIALTGSNAKLIKYYSNAKITSNATARNSSTIKSQKVSCGSKAITTSTGTINGVESGTFTFAATDSRGYQTILTKKLTLVEYVKLTCSMEAGMPTTAGVASLAVSGNYWNGNFGQVANTLTIQYRYKVQGESYGNWASSTATITKSNSTYKTEITISGLNYQNAYTFQVRAVDKLATVESNEQTRKTTPVFDWGKNDFNINGQLNVGGAIVFDKGEQTGERQIYFKNTKGTNPHNICIYGGNPSSKTAVGIWDSENSRGILSYRNIDNKVYIGNSSSSTYIQEQNLADFVVEQGTSGIWYYRKWNSGIAECWGREQGLTLSSGWCRGAALPFRPIDWNGYGIAQITRWYGTDDSRNASATMITCGGLYEDGSLSIYERNYDGSQATGWRAIITTMLSAVGNKEGLK